MNRVSNADSWSPAMMARHAFGFTRPYRLAGLGFGVTPSTTWVEVGVGLLRIRFGPWRLHTDLDNVAGVETSRDYAFVKTAGPAHLSLADHGITFATNGQEGVCLKFVDPVPVGFLVSQVRCPGATVTPESPERLLSDLRDHGVAIG